MVVFKWFMFAVLVVLVLHARSQSSYGEPGRRISFPIQLWCKSKHFMDTERITVGADLTYYKNTLPANSVNAQVIRQNYAAVPVYVGFNLDPNWFVESGLFGGIGLYRSSELPVLTSPNAFRNSHFGFDAGMTTSVGYRLTDQGVLRLRMSKCLKESTAQSKTWMPGRLELSIGLRLP
ncbi:MAG TPA: hypothetical protein PKE06_06320 [Flavilitoribacter sp.]|nr:hypothetical protein [Flavilitoribacter sp.]HMQ85986.1 hypothetical protein [Flavilitoribacter sp.]